jgi:hypothetical protein
LLTYSSDNPSHASTFIRWREQKSAKRKLRVQERIKSDVGEKKTLG